MRLIDADALIVSKDWADCTCPAQAICKAPTIEAEPVRHGCEHCKDGTYHGQVLMLCNDGVTRKIEFCPSCGAKMDGKEKEE